VSNIIVRLKAEQIVRRVGDRRRGQAGRPEGVLEIDPDGGTFIGVAIEEQCIRLIACALDGGCRGALAVESGSTMGSTLAYLQRGIHTLIANLGANFDQVRGIRVEYHGLIDRYGHLVLAPRFGLRDIPLGTLLRGLFPVPVHLENNTKAATLAEHLFGACRDVDDFVLVHGGSGISGALYLQGTLYHGTGFAGELGHIKMVPNGRPCRCGGNGCLVAYISDSALRARLAESGRTLPDTAAIVRAASANAAVRAVLAAAGEMLGVAVANLVNLLNPRRVVLAGTLAELSGYLLPAARAALAKNALVAMDEDVTILVSELGGSAVELGVGFVMESSFPLRPRPCLSAWR
jgi:predicted NBD/HSP70 family sugar kinase